MKRSRLVLPHPEYKLLLFKVVFPRDKYRCRVCRVREGLHGHHIVFRSHGGDDASYNLLTLCNDCHDAVHQRHVIITAANGKLFEDGLAVPIDADQGVRLYFVNGWSPKKKVR